MKEWSTPIGEYRRPKDTDLRSPCPALNTLANHGHLCVKYSLSLANASKCLQSLRSPRDGRNVSAWDITYHVNAVYGLSIPLAALIAYGTVFLLKKPLFSKINLQDIATNPGVEHCASLAHTNTPKYAEFGATSVCPHLSKKLLEEANDGGYTAHDFARIRVRREREPGMNLQGWRGEIARGECSLTLNVFAGDDGKVSKEVIDRWWINEQLPEGFKPARKTTLWRAAKVGTDIRNTMKKLEKTE